MLAKKARVLTQPNIAFGRSPTLLLKPVALRVAVSRA